MQNTLFSSASYAASTTRPPQQRTVLSSDVEMIRRSAGTRSPSERRTKSPGTSCAGGTRCSAPSRITVQKAASMPLMASISFSVWRSDAAAEERRKKSSGEVSGKQQALLQITAA